MSNSRTGRTVNKSPARKPAARSVTRNHASRGSVASAPSSAPSVEQRAYEIYSQRVSTGAPGTELSDWLQAESELRSDEE